MSLKIRRNVRSQVVVTHDFRTKDKCKYSTKHNLMLPDETLVTGHVRVLNSEHYGIIDAITRAFENNDLSRTEIEECADSVCL